MPYERVIPDPGFAGDDGEAPEAVRVALEAYDRAPEERHAETLALLQETRVLVPVLAVLGDVEYDEHGLAHDKTSDMATVLITGRDGRKALLAFTSMAALQGWNPESRPVPVPLRQAARSALQDGADALVIDVAGPVLFAVEGEELRSLGEGLVLRRIPGGTGGGQGNGRGNGWGWTRSM